MNKKILLFTLAVISQYGIASAHTILGDASTLTRGTLPNARLDPSSVTLQGNGNFPNLFLDASSVTKQGNLVDLTTTAAGVNILNQQVGPLQTQINNFVGQTTFTFTINYGGSVFQSTTGLMGLPGTQFTTGSSTWFIRGIIASFAQGSTVAMTSVQLALSTGALNSLPVSTTYFPRVDIPTAAAINNYSSFSDYLSTNTRILNGQWIGVQITTVPVSGIMPRGLQIDIDLWKPLYSR